MRAPRRAAVLALGLALAAACADLAVDPAIGRITTPIANPSFSNDIAPILEQTCASSRACHLGPDAQKGLELSAESAYVNVVNVVSQFGMVLVTPGDTAFSFLPRVMSTDPAVRFNYYRMPQAEQPMPAPVVQTIYNWIKNGAPNN